MEINRAYLLAVLEAGSQRKLAKMLRIDPANLNREVRKREGYLPIRIEEKIKRRFAGIPAKEYVSVFKTKSKKFTRGVLDEFLYKEQKQWKH